MQIRVHEVEHQVDVPVILGSNYVLQTNDILVAGKLLQEDDLSERALGIGSILERVEVLLERHDLLGPLVNRLPDNTISTLTEFLENFVLLEYVCLNLLDRKSVV